MIVTFPNPMLSARVAANPLLSRNIDTATVLLREAASLRACAGLAANQVGRVNTRVFLVGVRVYINPTVTACLAHALGRNSQDKPEGCFSLPGRVWVAQRFGCILLDYTGLDGTPYINQHISGFTAQVIQHEYDHLEGKLINRFRARNEPETYAAMDTGPGEDLTEPG